MVLERSESNASGQASRAVFVANCSLFIELQCAVRYGLGNVVICVVFRTKQVTRFRLRRSASNGEMLIKMNLTSKLTDQYWLYMVKKRRT